MAGFKTNRIASELQKELSSLVRTLKDPRISQLLSIVKVDVSGDLSVAKIYVSAIEGVEASKKSVKGLESASGYLKREISSKLKLRKMPEFKFIADDSISHSAHIADIISTFEYKNQEEDINEE